MFVLTFIFKTVMLCICICIMNIKDIPHLNTYTQQTNRGRGKRFLCYVSSTVDLRLKKKNYYLNFCGGYHRKVEV